MNDTAFLTPLVPGVFMFKVENTQVVLPFQFNPEDLQRTRTANVTYSAHQQHGPAYATSATAQFSSPNQNATKVSEGCTVTTEPWSLELKIRLDSSIPPLWQARAIADRGSEEIVNLMIYLLDQTIEPVKSSTESEPPHGYETYLNPPVVTFIWGWRVWQGYIKSMTVHETMFRFDLLPMRAEVSFTMEVLQMSNLAASLAAGLAAGLSASLSLSVSGGFSL